MSVVCVCVCVRALGVAEKGQERKQDFWGRSLASKKEQIIEVISYTYYTSVYTSVVAKLTSNALDRNDITYKRYCKTSTKITFINGL